MSGLLLEPRAVAGRRGARSVGPARAEAEPAKSDLTSTHPIIHRTDPARARSALASASLAACVVGLLGVPGGVIWIVGGVWTLRMLAGDEPSIAWGIACAGAAMRWGTLGLGDVEVATRLLGPSALSGPLAVRIGLVAALLAALASEALLGGLRARSIPELAAAVAALVTLVPLFCVRGGSTAAAPQWLVASAVLAAVVLYAERYVRVVPRWVPPVIGAAGVMVATLAR